jgi:curved DNA-binding protein CbpA
MDALESGDLATTPLAALLLDALERGATGALTVNHSGAHSRVFVRDGLPAGAQSFASFRPLGQILVQQGRIDMDALSRSLAEMARTGRPQGEILIELGAVSSADVSRALAEQQAAYVHDIAARAAGVYAWEPGLPPEWTRGARVPPLRAIVAALRPAAALPLVEEILAGLGEAVLTLTPAYDEVAHAFAWTPEESRRLEPLRAGCRAPELATEGVDPGAARAVLAALVRLGLAGARGAATAAVPRAIRELAPPRQEHPAPAAAGFDPDDARRIRRRMLSRGMQNTGVGPLAQPAPAGGAARAQTESERSDVHELRAALEAALPRARDRDLFARLGVQSTATREQVKQAYLALARRFHPDRFLVRELADLQPKVQELFAALNEAHHVLGDDRRRTEHLASLGAAWVSEDAAARVDFEKGEACFRTRDFHRARGFYEAAIRAGPRPEYLAAAAHAIVLEGPGGDRERARDLVRGALADPRCDRAAWVAGVLARDDGDEAAAERHFRAALHVNPRNADAARELRALEMRRSGNTRK